jgi:uncharacterized membrane protein (UPF0127 family)
MSSTGKMNPTQSKIASLLGSILPKRRGAAEVRYRITNLTRQTEIANRIEIADRGERRRIGLLGRTGLSNGEGLWIVPCEAVHTFGMQFPIDLVYLDRRHRVVKTRSHVRPGRLSACLTAHSVVELPTGTVRNTLTMAGDALELQQLGAANSAD